MMCHLDRSGEIPSLRRTYRRGIPRLRFAALGMTIMLSVCVTAAEWRRAERGWQYEFPRDHGLHEEFKTEWWYFTGNLADANGRRFGYQLTFFRQGIRHPAERDPALSRFVVGDLKFAHFTITDVAGEQFRFEQNTSRGAFGEAGFSDGNRIAWLDSWTLRQEGDNGFHLTAEMPHGAIDLRVRSTKPPVIHGEDGFSRKAAGDEHASHYYSLTRLLTTGELRFEGDRFQVTGESWFDHEWATNQLAPQQVGWDWLSAHFDDGSELMLYQIRLANCAADPSSSGTAVTADGTATHLPTGTFQMKPTQFWKSSVSGAKYPVGWQIQVAAERLQVTVRPTVENQELAIMPLTYWEGAVEITGTRDGKPIKGRGYLELTGYAGPLRELQR